MVAPIDSAAGVFSGGFSFLMKFWWVFIAVVVLVIIAAVVWFLKKWKEKDTQWTHKLNVKVELPNGELDEKVVVHLMRRWKHKDEKTPPLFELEKPLIGSRIMTELEKYSGSTTYEVVLGNDGRLYIPTKTFMSRDKNALEVSVKHAGIDRARQQYGNRFEQQNATPSKIDTLTLMKYGLYGTAIILVFVLLLVGINAWRDRASYDEKAAQAELASWEAMGDTMEIVESALNTVTLILPDLKDLKGNNLQGAINNQKSSLEQS